MSIEIDFSGEYSYAVQVQHADLGELGEATLLFGTNHWPHLRFKNWQAYSRLGDGKKYDRLRAITQNDEIFTLLCCSVTHNYLSIEYVVAGNVTGKFKSIGIRFNEINEWFMPFRSIEDKINHEPVDSERHEKIFATIKSKNQIFNLFSETVLRVKKSGEDHIVHEHVLFIFERTDGFFCEKDLQQKSQELSNLFSILMAEPLHLASVKITSDDGDECHVFFSSFKNKDMNSKKKGWNEYFIKKSLLDGRWQEILDNYYKSQFRELSWIRLAGMQRYEGFWEYKALGYVSLLDKYVDLRTNEIKKEPSNTDDIKNTKVHDALKKISPVLTSNQEHAVFEIMVKFFMSGRKLNFRDKFNHVLSTMDAAIQTIINLSSKDFEKIKEIRDAVAHGDAPNLMESDYGRVEVIVAKISLFLTYWAFRDFGLTNEDFLKCLGSHSQLHLRADIDRIEYARVTKNAGFFKVDKDKFDKLSQIESINIQACFLVDDDGNIEYSMEYVSAFNAWLRRRVAGEIPVSKIFNKNIEKIKCWGQAYIECGTERLELVQAYFIKSA